MQEPSGGGHSNNFEILLKKNCATRTSAIYNTTNIKSNIIKPQDVLDSVYSQIKNMQLADGKNLKIFSKDMNRAIKSTFLTVNKLPVYTDNEVPKQSNFETQCVSNTQLINIIEDAEALIDTHKGMTQEFNTTFIHTNTDDRNTPLIFSHGKKDRDVLETREFETTFTQTNVDETSTFLHDIEVTDNPSTDHTQLHDKKLDTDLNIFENVNTLKEMCDKVLRNKSSMPNVLLIKENYCKDVSNKLKEQDGHTKDPIDTLNENEITEINDETEEANHTMQTDSMKINYIYEERSLSPVLEIKTDIKLSKIPLNLVVPLESFEKFERLTLPFIDINNDFDNCKYLINSQILRGELCLYTDENVMFNENGQFSPTSEKKCDILQHNANEEEDNIEKSREKRKIVDNFDNLENSRGKRSDSLKDEILFSSDEETDFMYREFQDIPLTVALESSFYDQSDVLEKNMYVGFLTASHKSIKICTDAFQKAQLMLDEDDNINGTDFSLTELVEICDEKNFSNVSLPELKIQEKTNSKVKAVETKLVGNKDSEMALLKFKEHREVIEDTEVKVAIVTDYDTSIKKLQARQNFVGLKTVSSKKIDLSDKALNLGMNIFKKIGLDEKLDLVNQDTLEQMTEKTKPKDKIVFDPEHDIDDKINDDLIIQEFENIEMSLKENKTSDEVLRINFQGFKTASNRNIYISNAAEAKAKNVFEDIDLGEINEKTDELIPLNQSLKNPLEATAFFGFKTANNKNIEISAPALAKTMFIFQDLDTEVDKPANDFELKNYKVQSVDLHQPSTSKTVFVGFKTANNKDIKISDVALSKSSKIFKDVDSENTLDFENNENKPKNNLTKNFNPNLKLSQKSIAKGKKPLEDLGTEQLLVNLPNSNALSSQNHVFKGFQTASKKPVSVSAQALEISKNIFQGIDDNEPVHKINNLEIKFKDFQSGRNKDSVTKEAIDAGEKLYNELKTGGSTGSFAGFKTASNKIVNISEEAMANCKKIFDNIDELPEKNILSKEIPRNPYGFQTVNNKQVKISKIAVEKTKPIFNDPDIPDTIKLRSFSGFQTASNKKVEISEEALKKTKALFNDIEITEIKEQRNFEGFASNKQVDISEEALEKTESFFKDIEVPELKIQKSFSCFQTASKKRVVVSEQALAKSRRLLQDVDTFVIERNKEHEETYSNRKDVPENSVFSFKTANDENSNVSEDALTTSRKLLKDSKVTNDNKSFVHDLIHIENKTQQKDHDINLDNIINTQVLHNFEENFCTEDFKETPRNNKRSSSPILSCPRAKKRKKFETPYKEDNYKKAVDVIKTIENSTCTTNIKFSDDYKKNKIYTLKDLTKMGDETKIDIDPYISLFNLDNILNFEFEAQRNGLTDSKIGAGELKKIFLCAVNRNLVPEGWLDNHLKLILWKLLSYEIRFPKLGPVCIVQNVIDQLKYRYDKELYNAKRPALRKIFERDDVSTKTMVLCVAGVYVDGVSVISVTKTQTIELLLTDGWYFIKATIDKMLSKLVCDGRVTVGCKIVTNGAELVNCEQGISPWEDTSAVRLKLFGNSTRPAPWDSKLGYSRAAILSHLSSVKVDGGRVSRLQAFVTRVYPMLYVEKFEDGSTVTRSERLEHLHQMKYEGERELMMERIYEEVQREFSDQESQDSEIQDSGKRRYCDSGSQIAKMMKSSKDPMEFRAQLSSTQAQLLQEHTTKYRDKLLEVIQNRIQEKITARNVVSLARGRIAQLKDGILTKGMLSMWKPNEAVLEMFKEGACIEAMNVVPTAIRYSEIQITAGRQSVFRPTKCDLSPHLLSLKRKCYEISDVAQNPSMTIDYNEIDTVGIVFLIEPSHKEFESSKNFQNVYLADANKNIICVNFWGGVKKFGFENILDTGQVVACANLQKRAGNTRKNIPHFRVTEFTSFTKSPRNVQARELVDDLNKKSLGLDRRKFCEDCIEIKNKYTATKSLNNNENESPYRFNKSDYSFARNKMFINTPVGVKTSEHEDVNLNLTGLDFESTFKQDTQELSPKTLLRKKKVNDRIAKLKMYGEPPPLSPINIINKSINATNSYKSPISTSSAATSNLHSVATVNKLPEENSKANPKSPIISMKRSYINSVPVKLNFGNENKSDLIDHFAEEFEGSPPLSLE